MKGNISMRDRLFRSSALVLGVLVIPSVAWQIYRAWPLELMQVNFLAGQILIGIVFLGYGLGKGPMANHGYQASKPVRTEESAQV
jgi:RsiW-degrading membrane proteinase PrsW (M82 family)